MRSSGARAARRPRWCPAFSAARWTPAWTGRRRPRRSPRWTGPGGSGSDGPVGIGALNDFAARLRVVSGRRLPMLAALGVLWIVLALALRSRRALRIGGLAVLWVLPVLLGFAALAPARAVEEIGAGAVALALAALTDALAPWPRAPLVPAAVALVAYAVDLAAGSSLIVRSLFGPNPLFGARFYGVGNELEATLPVLALAATAAALVPAGRSRRSALTFAAVGVVVALVLGAGRLGAD